MDTTKKRAKTSDLIRLLDVQRQQQEQLLECIESKIDAMRRADVSAMQQLHQKEKTLVTRIREREGLRQAMMDAIGSGLGLPAGAARALHVSQLAGRLPEPDRGQLIDAAHRLRDVVFRLQRTNRVAGVISRELINHLDWVFASVAPKREKPAGYSGDGTVVRTSDVRVFEAVG